MDPQWTIADPQGERALKQRETCTRLRARCSPSLPPCRHCTFAQRGPCRARTCPAHLDRMRRAAREVEREVAQPLLAELLGEGVSKVTLTIFPLRRRPSSWL